MSEPGHGATASDEQECERPTVVYITSVGHSGSTLLDLLISSHSRVVSVGEIKQLNGQNGVPRCTCRASTLLECPFWQTVDRQLRSHDGRALEELDLAGPDHDLLEADNLALFRAVAAVSGRSIIVDSSKNLDRLQRLLVCRGLELRVIHLLRSPFGVAHSCARKGRSPVGAARHLARRTLAARWLLRDRPHLEVRYERLTENPGGLLAEVMEWLGLEPEPGQLEFAGRERHNLGGNRMRFSSDSTIVADLAWRTGLSLVQKLLVAAASAPSCLPGATTAYAGWRWLRRAGTGR